MAHLKNFRRTRIGVNEEKRKELSLQMSPVRLVWIQ